MRRLLEANLTSGLQAAREARRLVGQLEGLDGVADDIILLVSELVTNSYRHGGLKAGDGISLTVTRSGKTVRVEVSDPGRGVTIPAPRTPTVDGGWGLEIVRRTAHRWGVRTAADATVVWFEFDTDM